MIKQIKTYIPIIIALLLLLGVVVGLNLVRRTSPQTIESKADVEFVVSLSPRVLTGIVKDSEVSFDLILNTTGKLVSAVDVELEYPNSLTLTDFRADTAGSGLDTAVVPGVPDNFSNTLRYVGVNKAGSLPVRNTIRIGTLKFKAVKDGNSKIEVIKATITIPGDTDTVSPKLDFGTVTIGNFSPSPSPSPSGSPTASSSPVSSPSSSPSVSPTPPPAPACLNGAVKGNRCVGNLDFVEWFKEWSGVANTKNADFFPECNTNNTRGDGIINIADFEVWRRESGGVNKCQ